MCTEVLQKAHSFTEQTAKMLSELVQRRSLSGGEEQVIKLLGELCTAAGFDEVHQDGLGNLIARIGKGPRIVAFDAHIDTVDTGDTKQWEGDPFSGEIRSGYVYGRGSVDQKGGAAALITAGRILKQVGYDGALSLFYTFTVNEEDCEGLCWNYLIEQEGLQPDFGVLTEPTALGIYRGHRGRLEIDLSMTGRACHGSAPERGVNAIYKAARLVLEIERLHGKLREDPFLGKGSVTVTNIDSQSPSLCAVPDFCALHLDRRLTWGETKDSALSEIRALGQGLDVSVPKYTAPSYKGLIYEQESYFPTWQLALDHPFVQVGVEAYQQLFNGEPIIGKWTFSTNGVSLCGKHSIPTIGFGPGDERYAHGPNERIPIDHLGKAAAFYAFLPFVLEQGGL